MSYSKNQYDFWKNYKKNGNSSTVRYVGRLACDMYYNKPTNAGHDYYTQRCHDRAVAEQSRANAALAWSLGSAIAPDSTYYGGRRVGNTNIIVPSDW
mmetsp:Transcript_33261/g.29144  ORF Transcript_33261/g.29144 Transcript_33261/m.29144 type:complete len:97 (-) Transcript_33261:268-558(-)|eukprot:CAMPEP_0201590340 /NCGR_PEP_ID=MMETSP0190_2-20130828/176759_1 /ASSEMBLY_ACC=CAM_ASM_000263 /TAXON_ID=37353 /ORGANISM="Rosalina sp." /LENGTH=96 /DNA_ID=CAMNT_0048046305 /DNA_START=91 /DNA_END=381 /DNA_ORIENTATION=+